MKSARAVLFGLAVSCLLTAGQSGDAMVSQPNDSSTVDVAFDLQIPSWAELVSSTPELGTGVIPGEPPCAETLSGSGFFPPEYESTLGSWIGPEDCDGAARTCS